MLGLMTTFVAIIIAYFLTHHLTEQYNLFRFDLDSNIWGMNSLLGWLNGGLDWLLGDWFIDLIFFFTLGFLFVPLSTVFISIYLDDIVDAVEERFYFENKAGKRLGIGALLWIACVLAFWIIVLNILVIPLYFVFFFVPFVSLGIFIFLNSYLLGWGYYEMVAVRHLGRAGAAQHRRYIRSEILLGGLLITGLYTLPVINMVAPIIGAAILCHLFHLTFQEKSYRSQSSEGL